MRIAKSLFAIIFMSSLVSGLCRAQTAIDINQRTKGNLPPARIQPGVAGQCLTTNISGATVWATCSAGGGSGTVTSFSAGNVAPLFTCSVSNPTTTPALTCTLSNATAHTYLGNNTGSAAGPAYVHPASTELADFSATAPSTAGKIPIYDPTAANAAGGTGAYVPGDPLVQGLNADGSTSAENPVAIGGYDTAGTPALHRATWINGNPAGTEYGLVTRNIPSGTQTITGSVSVSNFPATQAVSAAALPLPSGASTSAKQPALGTAGSPSADVITIQGVASMTAVKVDPSAVTSPVSLASVPLPTGAAQDSTLTGGTTKAINRGGAKGTTTAADVTSTASGANHQGLDVALYDGSGNQLGLSGAPVRTDPTGTTTQPVSGTVSAAQSGIWTVQPGNTANTTAWKVDGSAVTQPISAASLPLPSGAATSANQSTVKAASTQAASTDTSSVVQINPNQPQFTTPLNFQGSKTNNNAAPSSGNLETIPSVANAAPVSYTEGNAVKLSMDLKGNLRVNNHPPDVVGCYQVNGRTSTYSGLSAAAPLFSFRWGDSTHLAIINHVKVQVIATVAATTAGQAERELIVARSFTASDTGGTAVTLTGNNQKLRTSFGTTLVTDMRFGTTITAGTRTLDANPMASAVAWLPLNMTGVDIGCSGASPTSAVWSCVSSSGYIDLLNTSNNQDYPLILAQNEGFIVRIGKDAMPAGATQQTYVTVAWCEVNAY